ncbi:MAG TPA: DUF3343 domain-containing protein [Chloroflexi bacterium]|nr:DUF3343 domain-containing protein [Chloroflexota bacterium]
MPKTSYCVVLFYSTSEALRVEKLCKERDLRVKLIPVPRQLSSDCGICLRFEHDRESEVREILDERKIEIQGVYRV